MIVSRVKIFVLFLACIAPYSQGGNTNSRVQDMQRSSDAPSERQNTYTARGRSRRNAAPEISRPRQAFTSVVPVSENNHSNPVQRSQHALNITINLVPDQIESGRVTYPVQRFVGDITIVVDQSGPSNIA